MLPLSLNEIGVGTRIWKRKGTSSKTSDVREPTSLEQRVESAARSEETSAKAMRDSPVGNRIKKSNKPAEVFKEEISQELSRDDEDGEEGVPALPDMRTSGSIKKRGKGVKKSHSLKHSSSRSSLNEDLDEEKKAHNLSLNPELKIKAIAALNTPKSLSRSGSIRAFGARHSPALAQRDPPASPAAKARRQNFLQRSKSSKESSSGADSKDPSPRHQPKLMRQLSLKALPSLAGRNGSHSGRSEDSPKDSPKSPTKAGGTFKIKGGEAEKTKGEKTKLKSENTATHPIVKQPSMGEAEELPELPELGFRRLSSDTRGGGSSPSSMSVDSMTILPRGRSRPSEEEPQRPQVASPSIGPGHFRDKRQNSDPGVSLAHRPMSTLYVPPKETRSGHKKPAKESPRGSPAKKSEKVSPLLDRIIKSSRGSSLNDSAGAGKSSTSSRQSTPRAGTSSGTASSASVMRRAHRKSEPFVSLDLARLEAKEANAAAFSMGGDSSRTMDSGRILPARFHRSDSIEDEQADGIFSPRGRLTRLSTENAGLVRNNENNESLFASPQSVSDAKTRKKTRKTPTTERRDLSEKEDLNPRNSTRNFRDRSHSSSSSKGGNSTPATTSTTTTPSTGKRHKTKRFVPPIPPRNTEELSSRRNSIVSEPVAAEPVMADLVTESEVTREISRINGEMEAASGKSPKTLKRSSKASRSSSAGVSGNVSPRTPRSPGVSADNGLPPHHKQSVSSHAFSNKSDPLQKKSNLGDAITSKQPSIARTEPPSRSSSKADTPQNERKAKKTVSPTPSRRSGASSKDKQKRQSTPLLLKSDVLKHVTSTPVFKTPRKDMIFLEKDLHTIRGSSGYLTPSLSIYHENGEIVGMTLACLVDTVFELNAPLCHKLADPTIQQSFWRTYYLLIGPNELLRELIARIQIYQEEGLIDQRVLLRVDEIVSCWIHFYYYSDEEDLLFMRLLGQLDGLLEPTRRHTRSCTRPLVSTYEKRLKRAIDLPPLSKRPSFILDLFASFDRIKLDPKQFAFQLTAYVHQWVVGLQPTEFFPEGTTLPGVENPFLDHLRKYHTALADFIQASILYGLKKETRLGAMRYFIEVAQDLRARNDFFNLNVILCGLSSGNISRLSHLRQLDPKLDDRIQRISAGFVPTRGIYRKLLREFLQDGSFFIPDVINTLNDVIMTLEGNPAYLRSSSRASQDAVARSSRLQPLVNLHRMRILGSIFQTIRASQKFRLRGWVKLDPATYVFLGQLSRHEPDTEVQEYAYYERSLELERPKNSGASETSRSGSNPNGMLRYFRQQ